MNKDDPFFKYEHEQDDTRDRIADLEEQIRFLYKHLGLDHYDENKVTFECGGIKFEN